MNQDFRDLLQLFIVHEVQFLVVGAYALAVLGQPRATGDLDVWVEPTPENAPRVYAALEEFGAPLHDLTVTDLETPGVVFQIGVVPRRIDVLTAISAVEFTQAWQGRVEGNYEGVRFPVIGQREFLTNKRATGRPKDLLDARRLESGSDD